MRGTPSIFRSRRRPGPMLPTPCAHKDGFLRAQRLWIRHTGNSEEALRCRERIQSEGSAMKYDVISADCHIDLIWLPPDLFTDNAPSSQKERMPYVTDGLRGKEWVTKNGSSFGLMNGMGSAGRKYEPGK